MVWLRAWLPVWVHCPWWWVGCSGEMTMRLRNQTVSREPCPIVSMSTINPTRATLVSNPGFPVTSSHYVTLFNDTGIVTSVHVLTWLPWPWPITAGHLISCGPGSSDGIATTGWTVRDRIPVGTRFSARPDRPWGPPSLLYNGCQVFLGGKVRPGRAADHSPPSSAAVMKE